MAFLESWAYSLLTRQLPARKDNFVSNHYDLRADSTLFLSRVTTSLVLNMLAMCLFAPTSIVFSSLGLSDSLNKSGKL